MRLCINSIVKCYSYVTAYLPGSGINQRLINNGRDARDYHGNGTHAGLSGYEIIEYVYTDRNNNETTGSFQVNDVKWDGAYIESDGVDFEHPAPDTNNVLVVWDPNHRLHARTNNPEGGIFIHKGHNSEGCVVLGRNTEGENLYELIRRVYQDEKGKILLTTRTVDNVTRLRY